MAVSLAVNDELRSASCGTWLTKEYMVTDAPYTVHRSSHYIAMVLRSSLPIVYSHSLQHLVVQDSVRHQQKLSHDAAFNQ